MVLFCRLDLTVFWMKNLEFSLSHHIFHVPLTFKTSPERLWHIINYSDWFRCLHNSNVYKTLDSFPPLLHFHFNGGPARNPQISLSSAFPNNLSLGIICSPASFARETSSFRTGSEIVRTPIFL
ncbi:hypothetical protein ACFX1W_038754 [Malus domestica]